jgi:two-component system, response regulator
MKELNILLVEDNCDHADLITWELNELNFVTLTNIENGELAITYLQEDIQPIQMVLLDINMPRISGIEVLKWIKNNPLYRDVAVIMLTTSTTEKEIQKCYDLGANSYIPKTFGSSQFKNVVQAFFTYWQRHGYFPLHN